jgi:hypothetical protein
MIRIFTGEKHKIKGGRQNGLPPFLVFITVRSPGFG